MLATQDKVYLSIDTPLGEDTLVLKQFSGYERISKPFFFDLVMTSKKCDLDFDAIVGKNATVTIDIGGVTRYFSGIIGEFTQGFTDYLEDTEMTVYTAKLYPKFWQLKYTKDCRIFQKLSTIDIITKVLEENGVSNFEFKTSQSRGEAVRNYCVQYNESCFDFISRLLEEEGIFYFFEHTQGDHKIIFADDPKAHTPCPDAEQAELEMSKTDIHFLNKITKCYVRQNVISKEHSIQDYNYKTPSTNLECPLGGRGNAGEIYEYPGIHKDLGEGGEDVRIYLEGDEWPQKSVYGSSTIPYFVSGFTSEFEGLQREDANKKYILFQVKHLAKLKTNGKCIYHNDFVAFDADIPYRPPRTTLKPLISGSQTAFVTGKQGEEIYTDEYGHIKVQFHWDREGKKDEGSSCWIRVAQGWASNNWGILFTPRIGQEVVVSYVNGDPDRPLVTGCVYNAEHMPPYLPDEPTKSTIKTDSSKGNDGYNELRFEDLKMKEQIYRRAETDDDTWVVWGTYTTTIERGDRRVHIKGVGGARRGDGNDLLNIDDGFRKEVLLNGDYITEMTKGDRKHTIITGNEIRTIETGNRTIELQSGDELHKITGNVTREVTGDYTVEIGGNLTINVVGNIVINGQTFSLTTKDTTRSESGTSTDIVSGTTTTIKVGTDYLLDTAASITEKAGSTHAIKTGAAGTWDAGPVIALTAGVIKNN